MPPNLMPIDHDDAIIALIQSRVSLAAKLNLLRHLKSQEESKVQDQVLPFTVFGRKNKEPFLRENTGALSKLVTTPQLA